jgi:hypothetical protein
MQKAPIASVSAGPVSPTVMGPEKEMKDVYIMSGLVFFLAVVVSAFWYYSQADEAAHSNPSTEALNSTQVSQVLKDSDGARAGRSLNSKDACGRNPVGNPQYRHPARRYSLRNRQEGIDR